MTQITSMTGPAASLRAQLRAQAEAALGADTNKTPFTDRLGGALREVAVAQNSNGARLSQSQKSSRSPLCAEINCTRRGKLQTWRVSL